MKNNNILTIALVIVIIGLSGFIIYDKTLSNDKGVIVDKNNDSNLINENNANVENDNGNDDERTTGNYKDYTEDCSWDDTKCTASYTFKTNDNYKSVVEVEDTFAVVSMAGLGKQLYILHEGDLYYDVDDCNENGYCNYLKYNLYHSEENTSKLKKFNKLSSIKRIISLNKGTGISYDLFLINENGEVYSLTYDMINNNFYFDKDDIFSQYEVDDIVEYNVAVPYGDTYKIILKDGTTLTKSVKIDD